MEMQSQLLSLSVLLRRLRREVELCCLKLQQNFPTSSFLGGFGKLVPLVHLVIKLKRRLAKLIRFAYDNQLMNIQKVLGSMSLARRQSRLAGRMSRLARGETALARRESRLARRESRLTRRDSRLARRDSRLE